MCYDIDMVAISRKELNRVGWKVTYAVRTGKLVKPDNCSNCDCLGKKLDGHHPDYTKPLKVEWLCRKCHKQRHGGAKGPRRSEDRVTYKGRVLPSMDISPYERGGLLIQADVIDEHRYFDHDIPWEKYLNQLSYRQREIIKLRYGIGDGYIYTLAEVAKIFKVTRERVRGVEAMAIMRLKTLFCQKNIISVEQI